MIICKNIKSISKVREGDVIVASMTRPEFMPALKKAAAIITDEGGITCHAAIISRELGIPAIIGTKIATKLLKDGMLVQVKANHGLVRILKNKKAVKITSDSINSINHAWARKKLGKIQWYQQAAAVKPLYISYPLHACSEMKIYGKKILPKYEIILFYKDNFMEDYISQRSLERVAKYYYNKQKKDKNFIQKLFNNWQKKFVSRFLEMRNDLLVDDFIKYSDKELLKLFQGFTKIYLSVWHEAVFLDGFDYYGEKILEEALVKEDKKIKARDLEILLTPPFPSFLQRERMSLLEIVEKIIKKPEAASFILKNKNHNQTIARYQWIEKELIKHSNAYNWLHNDFSHVEKLDSRYFFKNLIALLKDAKKITEERQMRNYLKSLNDKKQKLFKKYQFSAEFVNIINFLSLLGNFRDERKSYNQMAGSALNKLAIEFSRRTRLDINTVEHLFHWEIKEIFNLDPQFIKKAKERSKGVFHIVKTPKTYKEIAGKQGAALNEHIKQLIKQKNNLQGMAAYKGVVRGVVKIVKHQKDFYKFKKGEILVAPNTRPEYVPIMKIAGAIISEEGGIICHSAIVSRELKIPCIVGVQGIISVLKDGDLVEVDADKGVVKILK